MLKPIKEPDSGKITAKEGAQRKRRDIINTSNRNQTSRATTA